MSFQNPLDRFLQAVILLSIVIAQPSFAADHTKDSIAKIKELIASKKAVLVDVRELNEWNAGHIEGAMLMPKSKFETGLSDEELAKIFPKDKVVYLYCAGGYRCLDVAEMFEERKDLQLRALKQGYTVLLKEGFAKAEPDKAK